MKRREVLFLPEARRDLQQLGDWIAERAGTAIALACVQRIESFCLGLEIASHRGRRQDDIYPGLRIVGFERRVAIAFFVETNTVLVAGIHYGGRDWKGRYARQAPRA